MRRLSVLLIVLGLCVLPAVSAQGRAGTNKLTESLTLSSIAPGGAPTLQAGSANGSLNGAALVKATPVSGTGEVGTKARFTFTLFTTKGSISGSGDVTITATDPGPDPANPSSGSQNVAGSGKIASGTGAYKGAKGSFTYTGTSPSGQTYLLIQLKGSYRTG
jgi:hypothetical protein